MADQGSGEIRSLQIALAAYGAVLAMKLAAYFMTGVMALLAEALHTLSDIFVSAFLLAAALWSRKPADELHMFGHGRAQNAAALVAATLFISFTSLRLYEEAVPRLFQAPERTQQNLPLALGALGVSMLIAAVPLVRLYLQKERGAAARAQLMESINDELGLLAALLGTLFLWWGQPLADPLAAIAVATIIAYNGIKLLRENGSMLLGRSPGADFLRRMEERARAVPGVLEVHDLRAEYVGPGTVHAGMHVVVQRGLPVEEAERIASEVEARIHEAVRPGYCVIHVDAAPPAQA